MGTDQKNHDDEGDKFLLFVREGDIDGLKTSFSSDTIKHLIYKECKRHYNDMLLCLFSSENIPILSIVKKSGNQAMLDFFYQSIRKSDEEEKNAEEVTPLYWAIICRQPDTEIQALFEQEKNKLHDRIKSNLIDLAIQEGLLNTVKHCIQQDLSLLNKVDFFFGTAITEGHFSLVKDFIHEYPRLADEKNDWFLIAVEAGQLNLVKYFLRQGANLNAFDNSFYDAPALHIAAFWRRTEVFEYLLTRKKGRIDIDLLFTEDSTHTPPLLALIDRDYAGYKEIACLLRKKLGPNWLQTKNPQNDRRLVDIFYIEDKAPRCYSYCSSLLYYGCLFGDLEIVLECIQAGADVNLREDNIPISLILRRQHPTQERQENDLRIIEALVGKNPQVLQMLLLKRSLAKADIESSFLDFTNNPLIAEYLITQQPSLVDVPQPSVALFSQSAAQIQYNMGVSQPSITQLLRFAAQLQYNNSQTPEANNEKDSLGTVPAGTNSPEEKQVIDQSQSVDHLRRSMANLSERLSSDHTMSNEAKKEIAIEVNSIIDTATYDSNFTLHNLQERKAKLEKIPMSQVVRAAVGAVLGALGSLIILGVAIGGGMALTPIVVAVTVGSGAIIGGGAYAFFCAPQKNNVVEDKHKNEQDLTLDTPTPL